MLTPLSLELARLAGIAIAEHDRHCMKGIRPLAKHREEDNFMFFSIFPINEVILQVLESSFTVPLLHTECLGKMGEYQDSRHYCSHRGLAKLIAVGQVALLCRGTSYQEFPPVIVDSQHAPPMGI